MPTAPFPRLLGDVGGTNARFAWQSEAGEPPSRVATSLCNDHESLLAAIRHYLHEQGLPPPQSCGIGIANPITGDRVRMTNHHWSFSIRELKHEIGVDRLEVINDFAAVALSLPALREQDLHWIGEQDGSRVAGAPMAVLGAGTGLGVSCLLPDAGLAITGEGGHSTLSASDPDEAEILRLLCDRFGHASAERAVSGPGLLNLYEATAALNGMPVEQLRPADIIDGARSGTDPLCAQALGYFCSFMGNFAGNLALTFGARGGVYVAGGIAPRIIDELRASTFRARFEGKGRFRSYLEPIPTWVISSEVAPAFLGLSSLLDRSQHAA